MTEGYIQGKYFEFEIREFELEGSNFIVVAKKKAFVDRRFLYSVDPNSM